MIGQNIIQPRASVPRNTTQMKHLRPEFTGREVNWIRMCVGSAKATALPGNIRFGRILQKTWKMIPRGYSRVDNYRLWNEKTGWCTIIPFSKEKELSRLGFTVT